MYFMMLFKWKLLKYQKSFSCKLSYQNFWFITFTRQGFRSCFDPWGTFWAKWPKTVWKLQNQNFFFGGGGKTVGDMGGTSQFSGSGVIPPPTRVNPAREEIVGVTVEWGSQRTISLAVIVLLVKLNGFI